MSVKDGRKTRVSRWSRLFAEAARLSTTIRVHTTNTIICERDLGRIRCARSALVYNDSMVFFFRPRAKPNYSLGERSVSPAVSTFDSRDSFS